MARALRDAGLERINISLDTMDAAKFERLTRRPGFEQVIEGILAAKDAGFDPVKINAVAMRGVTEDDVVPLARFARESRPGAAVHRVHAARRGPPLGARKGLVRGRYPRVADPGHRAARPRRPTRTRARRRSITNTPTAAVEWASSPRSAGPSA